MTQPKFKSRSVWFAELEFFPFLCLLGMGGGVDKERKKLRPAHIFRIYKYIISPLLGIIYQFFGH